MIEPTLVLALVVAVAAAAAVVAVGAQISRNKFRKPERLASLDPPPPPPPPEAPVDPAKPLISVMPADRMGKAETAEEEDERRRAAAYSFREDRPGYDAKKVRECERSLELVLEEPEAKRPMTLRDIGDVPVKDALLYGALWYWVRSMLKSTR